MLREYQGNAMELVRQSYRTGHKSPVLVLPCGAGKTVLGAEIVKKSTEKGNQVLWLAHRIELIRQAESTFLSWGVNPNLYSAKMVQTACRHIDDMIPPDLIIVDEAHHSNANSYMKIFNAFPSAKRIGLTATPGRMDGKGLKDVYDDIIEGVTTKWLIDNHYLAPYRLFSAPLADVNNFKVVRGEYNMGTAMEDKVIYGDTVQNYKRIADGRKAIVYCSTVESLY